jgi:cysteinyl-tRNA synthetase
VRYVRNITDVGHLSNDSDDGEDKMLKQARLEQIEPMEVAQRYSNSFHRVTQQFNLLDPDIEPQATGHIIEQIQMIEQIIANGFAYESKGSVYFDINAFKEKHSYGELSGRNVEDLFEYTRQLDGQSDKRSAADFALWKKADEKHIMRWPSPWSVGFPGWHLECSAMSTKYLGDQFDIHGGGLDLQFPHHECEIAQNVGAKAKVPVKYWMHANMLTVNGQKMSKSVGNSFLPTELLSGDHPLLDQGFSPMTVRFFMLQSHYSSTLDFSNEALKASEKGYKRLVEALERLKEWDISTFSTTESDTEESKTLLKSIDDMYLNMSNDFNTAKSLASLFEMVPVINSIHNDNALYSKYTAESLSALQNTIPDFVENVLGLKVEEENANTHLATTLNLLIDIRAKSRANRDFATADQIRNELETAGIKLLDGKNGTHFQID